MKKPKYSLLAMFVIAAAAILFPTIIGVGLIIYLLEDVLHHDDVSIVIVIFFFALMLLVKKVIDCLSDQIEKIIDYFGDYTKD